jgi:uncharacterized protein YbbC (DUF1343 family)
VTCQTPQQKVVNRVIPGAERFQDYIHMLQGKRVGLVVNHTSTIGRTHLLDTLLSKGINVKAIFAPEHGFRGKADAGDIINNEVDSKTGIRIISLYGEKKKPSKQDIDSIDIMVFDIQDVGVRFYTYINTLQYVMESLASAKKTLVLLDRPNPNGHYIDGPVLDTAYRSFVGFNPVPIVYGMTMGEYAQMVNDEAWIPKHCELKIVLCEHYDHTTMFEPPIKPSPNLPNLRSILLYPGICMFEGTVMSLGRGTSTPFQVVGNPSYPDKSFSFTPVATEGAKNPPLKDKLCYGVDLSKTNVDSLFALRKMDLSILLQVYQQMKSDTFFNAKWFDTLAGGTGFRKAIEAGQDEAQIRAGWTKDLEAFQQKRRQYLLYPDFKK